MRWVGIAYIAFPVLLIGLGLMSARFYSASPRQALVQARQSVIRAADEAAALQAMQVAMASDAVTGGGSGSSPEEPREAGLAPTEQSSDNADVPSLELRANGDDLKRYFLIGAPADRPLRLLVVLPGGDGGAGFQPFVTRIWKHSLSKDWLVAQAVAPRWSQSDELVWPTGKARDPAMKFTTEEFIDAIVRDVRARQTIDERHVYALAWSSSGPAVYAAMMERQPVLHGAFIAMSVFKPEKLPPPPLARGRCFYLLHSRGDRVVPFRFAEEARDTLSEAKAVVELKTYNGGHGWRGDVFGSIRAGVEWLERNNPALPHPPRDR